MKSPVVYFIETLCGIVLMEVFNDGFNGKESIIYLFVIYLILVI